MKYIALAIALSIFMLSCSTAKMVRVSVTNDSNYDRANEMVEIPLNEIRPKFKGTKFISYVVKNAHNEIIPSQQTHDDMLIFQPLLGANERAKFTITVGGVTNFENKVNGRIYSERFDDFAWENDRVGFRFYGDKLKYSDGPSNGLDLWYKRTNRIVLDEWYEKNIAGTASYHVDHGEGCDPYAVGRTLGGGSMAPFVKDSLWLNENYLTAKVYDNGPLRTTFKLEYATMLVDGEAVSESKLISLDAGSQMTKIVQEYTTSKPISVAVGVVKRKAGDSIIFSHPNTYFVYADPATAQNGQVFVGVIIPQGIKDVFVNTYTYTHTISRAVGKYSNVLATTHYTPNNPVTYYTGFGWTKFGFADIDQFNTYVKQYSHSLNKPLEVKIK